MNIDARTADFLGSRRGAAKPAVQKLVDRVSAVFVPLSLIEPIDGALLVVRRSRF